MPNFHLSGNLISRRHRDVRVWTPNSSKDISCGAPAVCGSPAAELLASKLQSRPQPAAAGRAQLNLHHALIERTQPAMVQQQQEFLVPMGGQVEIHPCSGSQKEISDSRD